MKQLEVLGHWFNPHAPTALPRPQALVGGWEPAQRAAVLAYLRAGRELMRFPDPSFCRFGCGIEHTGAGDHTDGRWVWPEGLAHYVERHDVRLPEPFVAHAVACGGVPPSFRMPKVAFGLYDTAPWLTWARSQGACPDLDGFDLPDPDTRDRIRADLGAILFDQILVCRGSTREVLLLVDGALELHQLTAGGRSPQRFAGWHEWPVAKGGAGTNAAAGGMAAGGMAALRALQSGKPKPGMSFDEFFARRQKPGGDSPD